MTVLTPSAKDLRAVEAPFDVAAIRADFPILSRKVNGKDLVYLDNGASAQKPKQVLDTIQRAYAQDYANVHRGLHYLSNLSTTNFEKARESVRRFLNARSDEEIIFTRNATEAINLVASSYGGMVVGEGDEIVISILEHHSNIVPWHFHRERRGAVLKWVPCSDRGQFMLEEYEKLLGPRTKLVAITQMSNALGTITPIKEIVRLAHDAASRCWLTAARVRFTLTWTSRISAATSMFSPATRSTGQPASACSTAARTSSPRCRHTRAAAR